MNAGDTVYCVEYALTTGIQERTISRTCYHIDPAMILISDAFGGDTRYIGENAFASRVEAVAAAEAMWKKKIASVRKQLAKLENIRFV